MGRVTHPLQGPPPQGTTETRLDSGAATSDVGFEIQGPTCGCSTFVAGPVSCKGFASLPGSRSCCAICCFRQLLCFVLCQSTISDIRTDPILEYRAFANPASNRWRHDRFPAPPRTTPSLVSLTRRAAATTSCPRLQGSERALLVEPRRTAYTHPRPAYLENPIAHSQDGAPTAPHLDGRPRRLWLPQLDLLHVGDAGIPVS